MARGHGRILTAIWEDVDFLGLTPVQQRMYLFLISQPNLNHAGLLPLTLRRWSRKALGLTVGEVEQTLAELAARRFVVVDDDTEELLIRTFVRNDGVWRQPKVMAAAVSGAQEISSPALRRALLAEMDRLPLNELSTAPGARGPSVREQIDELLATLRRTVAVPEGAPTWRAFDPPTEGVANPSGALPDTPSEPFGKASGSLPDSPAEPFPNPSESQPEATTRAHVPASRAHSPAPAPTPAPTTDQKPSSGIAGEGPPPAGGVGAATPPDPEIREDVEQICTALADAIAANGSKRPTITKAWRREARLLLDRDERTVEQVLGAITWCQADTFWRGVVLSMPKLREKYDQLRLAAARQQHPTGPVPPGHQSPRPSTTDQRVAEGRALAAEFRALEEGPQEP